MDQKINKALLECIFQYTGENKDTGENQGKTERLAKDLVEVFESHAPFPEKVAGLDALVDNQPHLDELREVLFDLLLLNFFADDVSRLESDYMESEEWADIEDQTLDRGTELLNLLLYLAECADEDIDPDLDDYLREFLLVDEDEFQDEHHIYEPVISRQILVESSYEEIANAARTLPPDQELAELFYPMMAFFFEPNPDTEDFSEFVQNAPNPAFDRAVYQLIINYK